MRAGGDEADGRHAVVHQLARQLAAGHLLVADGEVEAVGHGTVQVAVIDHMEAVAQEDLLQLAGAVAIDLHLVPESVLAVARRTEHRGQRVLRRMAGAGAQRVEHSRGEDQAEGQPFVAGAEVGEMAVEERVADADDADALAGIGERLRAADEQHIIVRVAGHRGLVGRLERHTEILAEVHGEVSQVLHHDGVVLRRQFADGLQLALREAHPRGVVGIRIHDGADVALLEIALQLAAQLRAAEIIDVEGLVVHALHLQLHLLHGEAGVDEQHRVLRLRRLRAGEERGEGALHGTRDWYTALGGDVHADEGLHEARGLLLQFRIALDVGIAVGDAVLERLDLRPDAHLGSGQTGDAHLHLDELHPTLLLGHGCHLLHFADGGLGEVLNAQLGNQVIDDVLGDRRGKCCCVLFLCAHIG